MMVTAYRSNCYWPKAMIFPLGGAPLSPGSRDGRAESMLIRACFTVKSLNRSDHRGSLSRRRANGTGSASLTPKLHHGWVRCSVTRTIDTHLHNDTTH